MTSHTREKIASEVAVRGDGGVAGEGRVVGVPKFHSWGISAPCMPLTNINSDWMSMQRFLRPVLSHRFWIPVENRKLCSYFSQIYIL